jgi:hypothetical protein
MQPIDEEGRSEQQGDKLNKVLCRLCNEKVEDSSLFTSAFLQKYYSYSCKNCLQECTKQKKINENILSKTCTTIKNTLYFRKKAD